MDGTPDAAAAEARDESKPSPWLLGLGALGLILVPTLIGISLIRGSGDTQSDMGGMGGDAPAATPTGTLDLMSIVDGDMVVEVHGDGTATVWVTTTLDVACAISYGPTQALGSLATDSDMAGGGHTDHHPLLVNLQPDTEYFYRISAIGPDGAVYSSGLGSFVNGTTVSAAPGPNIALGGTIVDVSSEFSAGFAASNAIDGDRSTEWSSAGDGDDAFITIDLGEATALTGVGFRTREMTDGTSITQSFTVTVDDGAPLGPFTAGPGLAIAEFAATGRLIRIDVDTSTGGNTGAIEIEVYGTGDPTAAPPATSTPAVAGDVDTPAPNIALGAPIIDVSSEYSADYAAANVVDGDPTTEWATDGDGDDAHVVVDLGREADIRGVGFWTRAMSDGTSVTTAFTVTVDGGETFGPFEAGSGLTVAEFGARGITVRVDVHTSTGGNTGAVEIEVYGLYLDEEM